MEVTLYALSCDLHRGTSAVVPRTADANNVFETLMRLLLAVQRSLFYGEIEDQLALLGIDDVDDVVRYVKWVSTFA